MNHQIQMILSCSLFYLCSQTLAVAPIYYQAAPAYSSSYAIHEPAKAVVAPVHYAPAPVHYAPAPVHYAQAPVHYAQAPAHIATVEHVDPNPAYSFKYGVNDPSTGDHKSQEESLQNGVVHGKYTLAESDGTIREVTYTADGIHGFNAVVAKHGKAHIVAAPIHAVAAPIHAVAAPIHHTVAAPIHAVPAAYQSYSPYAYSTIHKKK